MSPETSTQMNTTTPLAAGGLTSPRGPVQPIDPARHVGPEVAHDLNNILTIVQGYADRLLLRHSANPALMPDLKLISEAARRAATVIRNARRPQANDIIGQASPPTGI
jgi:His Kinase A (phospho-acceptor) domain